MQAFYTAMVITAVGIGLTGVEGWKPLFGSLADCWSVRQLWGLVDLFRTRRLKFEPMVSGTADTYIDAKEILASEFTASIDKFRTLLLLQGIEPS